MGKRRAVEARADATPDWSHARSDGWSNALTGVGTVMYDKRLASKFIARWLSDASVEELYAGNDMAARLVEELPKAACKHGFRLNIADDQDRSTADACENRADEMNALKLMRKSMFGQRAYGGAALLMGADDGQRADRELDLKRVKTFNWLTPLSKRQLKVATLYDDANNPKFGQPETYAVLPTTLSKRGGLDFSKLPIIHESRLIVFQGVEISAARTTENGGWGDSIFTRIEDVLRDFQAAFDGAAILMSNAGQRSFKMKGLAAAMGSNNDSMVTKRAKMIELSRSICRAVLMDVDEEMIVEQFQGNGMDVLLDKFMLRLSAAGRTPVTILMGQAPAGLNATGDSDMRWWYDTVVSEQDDSLKPALDRYFKVLFSTKNGPTKGVEPPKWKVTFPAPYQLTDQEKAELRNKQAMTDDLYIANQVLTPEEVAKNRFGGTEYSTETKLDAGARARFAEAQAAIASADPTAPLPAGTQRGLPAGKPVVGRGAGAVGSPQVPPGSGTP
jgi:phage-related protein (TIGR01555 family)